MNMDLWDKVRRHPRHAIHVAIALLRGRLFLLKSRLLGRRVTGGAGLRIYGTLDVRGPGLVEIGNNVTVGMRVTPWTTTVSAVIRIGDNTFLNGARFACAERIEVGARCILAECRIMDTNFHSTHVNRHDSTAPVRVEAVTISQNVWIASDVAVLPGTHIGENSVVGIASVCSGTVPANVVLAGNPAIVVRAVPGA